MSDNQLIIYPYNLLGESGVTLSVNADSIYPAVRLYDRCRDFYWQYTTTGAFTITLDQGASFSKYIDFVAVTDHNWSGATVDWQYSDNGSNWVNAVAQFTATAADIVKTLTTSALHRWWRLSVGSVASPRATEVYMSLGYIFTIDWGNQNPTGSEVDNVEWISTTGGLERSIKNGGSKRTRSYPIFHHVTDRSTLASFRAAMSYLDSYSLPFFVKDHEDNYWLARFTDISEEEYSTPGTAHRVVSLLEML